MALKLECLCIKELQKQDNAQEQLESVGLAFQFENWLNIKFDYKK